MIRFHPIRGVLPLFLICCVMQAANAEDTKAAIENANAQFSAAAAKGDAAGLANLYTSDGQILPCGSDAVRGHDAIQKYWQGALSSGIAAVSLKTLEILGTGKVVTEVGQYELSDKSEKVLDQGKYIVVWRSQNGTWKLARDMFSTSNPPSKK
jgi:uncharacterized protein (TIGR02246 family)